jgi:hypothetical protein
MASVGRLRSASTVFETPTGEHMAEDTASRREFIKAVGAGALATGLGANLINLFVT